VNLFFFFLVIFARRKRRSCQSKKKKKLLFGRRKIFIWCCTEKLGNLSALAGRRGNKNNQGQEEEENNRSNAVLLKENYWWKIISLVKQEKTKHCSIAFLVSNFLSLLKKSTLKKQNKKFKEAFVTDIHRRLRAWTIFIFFYTKKQKLQKKKNGCGKVARQTLFIVIHQFDILPCYLL